MHHNIEVIIVKYGCSILSANNAINVFSNNKKIIEFLGARQFNSEFIPSYSYNKKISESPKHSVFVETINRGSETINISKNSSHIKAYEKKLYLPDMTFLLLALFSKIYAENDALMIHSCALEHKRRGFLIIGDQGDGKKELALAAAMNGFKIVSCENTIVNLVDDEWPRVIDGTKTMHVNANGVIGNKIIGELPIQDGKQMINEQDFEKIGIEQAETVGINYVIYAKIITGSNVSSAKQLLWPDNVLRLYKSTGNYLSGTDNIFLSNGKPFPNLEDKKLREARLSILEDICQYSLHFEVYGDPHKAVEFMNLIAKSC